VIRLRTKLDKKEGDLCTLRISVTDSGIGISPEQQSRLFGSFEQADSSTSRKFGGTGLGLAISKRIVEMMGGSFQVVSELGKGASFIFTAQLLEAAGELEEIPPVNWEQVRVLAVDDDPDIREYFVDIAERLGFVCDTAVDGEAALAMIEKNGSYDVYFVDWKMPGLNGIELSRRITNNAASGGEKSVIIMMSAVDWNTLEADARDAGVTRFVPKPLFPSSIADCISRSLGVGEQVSAAQAGEPVMERYTEKKILLAEDVDINREIVLALLEPTGLAIDCAENGKEALEVFTRTPESYDLIFMDVQMPEMDGYEATRQIRASAAPNARTIPIIAMTANVFREDVEQCLEAGMNSHVGKPLNLDEVLNVLRRYL
jgi:CheY-like chemotaxis protein